MPTLTTIPPGLFTVNYLKSRDKDGLPPPAKTVMPDSYRSCRQLKVLTA